ISYKLGHDLTYVDTLVSNNSIANKDLIYVGQKLVIKDDGEVAPATAEEVATLPEATESQASDSASAATTNDSAAQTSQTTSAASASATTSANYAASYNTTNSSSYTSTVSGGEAAAKAWIANRESGGSYSATNGQYIGKYQLSASYLNGDYSAENQERVADSYVASRYGSWTAAQAFWQ
ncbi:peptidase M23, partial [Lactobacillaceae bacterium 24-114]